MQGESQRGQRGRPKGQVGKPDLELRKSIIEVLKDLQKHQALKDIAEDLGTSEKNLRRYLSDKFNPPPTLGGDILFRLCEKHSINAHGKTLQCVDSESAAPDVAKSEQLRFEFVATLDVLLPSRKLVARTN